MELIKEVSKESHPELWQLLMDADHDFVTDDIPKHGKGYVDVEVKLEDGRVFMSHPVWDYSWGIDWDYEEWYQIDPDYEPPKCGCCGQVLP